MLSTITLTTSLYFAFLYPLCFWISVRDPLRNNFHHFHLGLPTIIGVIALIFVYRMPIDGPLRYISVLWMALAIGITAFYWRRETVSTGAVSVLALIGLWISYQVQVELFDARMIVFVISIVGGLIFCASLYTMNLGHWYLNVHGLPIKHLRHSNAVLLMLVAIRGVWDAINLFTQTVMYQGDRLSLFEFIREMDGFLLIIPIFFGVLFPLVGLFMVREIIRLKNTQAATGVLYVVLCAVLLADMAYKFYLIKYGIVL